MRGKDRGKAKADRRERGNMAVMSEMLNFGMGRPGDDDMKFHDLDGDSPMLDAMDSQVARKVDQDFFNKFKDDFDEDDMKMPIKQQH